MQPSVSVVSPSVTSSPPGNGSNLAGNSGALAGGSGLSTGAIVGIVIAILVILIAAVVFFMRRKNIFSRNKRRATWLAKGGIMGPKPIPEYDTNFAPGNAEKGPPPVPQGFGYRETYVPGGTTEAAAYAYSTNDFPPATMPQSQPDYGYGLVPPPTSYNNPTSATSLMSPVVMQDGAPTANVVCTFIPTLPDELNINTGDIVRVLAEYDDGWALCMNNLDEQGMVPLECLDLSGMNSGMNLGGQRNTRESRRVSSLIVNTSGVNGPRSLAPNRLN
jgi:hypothetical protein